MNKQQAQAKLQRLKTKLKVSQSILWAGTCTLGYVIGYGIFDAEIWIKITSGVLMGIALAKIVDDTFDLFLAMSIDQWSKSKKQAKKTLKITVTIVAAVFLLITSTLSITGTPFISKFAIKSSVTANTYISQNDKVDSKISDAKKPYRAEISRLEQAKLNELEAQDNRVSEAIEDGGANFAKLWNGGNKWIRTTTENPSIVRARNKINLVKKDIPIQKKAITKKYDKLQAEQRKLMNDDIKSIESRGSAVIQQIKRIDGKETRLQNILKNVIIYADIAFGLFVLMLSLSIIQVSKLYDIEFGEPSRGFDDIINAVFDRVFGLLKTYMFVVVGKADQKIKRVISHTRIDASVFDFEPFENSIRKATPQAVGAGGTNNIHPTRQPIGFKKDTHTGHTDNIHTPSNVCDTKTHTHTKTNTHTDDVHTGNIQDTYKDILHTKQLNTCSGGDKAGIELMELLDTQIVNVQFEGDTHEIEINLYFDSEDQQIVFPHFNAKRMGITRKQAQDRKTTYKQRAATGSAKAKNTYLYLEAGIAAIDNYNAKNN